MATITINIPDAVVTRVLNAIATRFGYDGVGTKAAFAKKQLILWLREQVREHESSTAAAAAAATASTSVDTDITIT